MSGFAHDHDVSLRQRGHAQRATTLGLAALLVASLGGSGLARGQPRTAVLLAPAQPAAQRATVARGVFYHQTVPVELPGGPLRLAASPDGQGSLCTDDQATLIFATAGGEAGRWSHRFSDSPREPLACIPPQPLDLALAPGAYTVTVALEDLYPDTYGSTGYYLIVDGPGATPASASGGPAALPVAASSQPLATAVPAAIPPRQSLPAATQPPPNANSFTAAPATTSPRELLLADWHIPALVAAALLACLALALLLRRRSPRASATPRLSGVVSLFDQETREARTAILPDVAGPIEVRRRPLDLVAPEAPSRGGAALAKIYATARGPELRPLDPSEKEPTLLQHDTPYPLADGAVVLRYRSAAGSPPTAARARMERTRG